MMRSLLQVEDMITHAYEVGILQLPENIISLAVIIIGIIGGFITYRKYSEHATFNKSKWLHEVYTEFFNKDKHREIRRRFDKDDNKKEGIYEILEKMNNESKDESDKKLEDDFIDYCNFFEMIIILKKNKSVNDKIINGMFGYYIGLFDDDEIKEWLKKYRFKHLSNYINTEMYKKDKS